MKGIRTILFFFVIGLCWLNSCSRDKSIPRNVIGLKKMGSILLDIQMAEAYNNLGVHDTSRDNNPQYQLKVFYNQILMLHHTDTTEFLRSFRFYEHHPDLMKKMYAQMLTEITKKSAYQDSISNLQSLRQSAHSRNLERMQEFKKKVFFYKSLADSLPVKPYRVFKPDGL